MSKRDHFFGSTHLDKVPQHIRNDARERLQHHTEVDLTAYSPDSERLLEDASMAEFKNASRISGYKRILDFMEPYLRRLSSTPATKLTEVKDRNQLCEYLYDMLQGRLEAIQKQFVTGRAAYLALLSNPTKDNLEQYMDIIHVHPNHNPHFDTFCGPYQALIMLENGFRYSSISKELVKAIFQWFLLKTNRDGEKAIRKANQSFKALVEDRGYEVSQELLKLDLQGWVPDSLLRDDFSGNERRLPSEWWERDYYWEDWMPVYLDSFETVIEEYVEYLEEISE